MKSAKMEVSLKSPSISTRWKFFPFLERIIFYAGLSLLVLVAIPFGSVDPFWESLFQSAVFILGALWVIEISLSGNRFIPSYQLFLPILAFVILALFQILPLWEIEQSGAVFAQTISFDPYETRKTIFKFLAFALFGAILLRAAHSLWRLHTIVFVIIGISIASALFGIWEQATGGIDHYGFFQRLNQERSFAQFINKNHFAFLMEMGLGLTFGLIAGKSFHRGGRAVYLAVALLLMSALGIAASRGGIVTGLCQIVLVGLLFPIAQAPKKEELAKNLPLLPSPKRKVFSTLMRLGLPVCLVIVILFGIIWVGGDNLADTLNRKPGEFDNSVKNSSRINIWMITWQLIEDHPVTGVGFGGYWIAITKYDDISGSRQIHYAHNEYLDILAAGGLLGFGIFIWLIVVFIKQTRRRLHQATAFHRAIIVGAWVSLLGVAVHSIVDFGLHVTANAAVFVALIVLATAELSYPKKKLLDKQQWTASSLG